jgi:hypothetical protein
VEVSLSPQSAIVSVTRTITVAGGVRARGWVNSEKRKIAGGRGAEPELTLSEREELRKLHLGVDLVGLGQRDVFDE